MKIPKKILGAAAKMFKSGGSAWSKKKQGASGGFTYMRPPDAWPLRKRSKPAPKPSFVELEELRAISTSGNKFSRARKTKLFADKYGNTTSLSANSGRIAPWRIGETYAPGERSKYDPSK